MKKKIGVLVCLCMLGCAVMTGCGKKDADSNGTENISTNEQIEYVDENPNKEADVTISEETGEIIEEDVQEIPEDIETEDTEEDAEEIDADAKEYNLAFYQYGEYLYDQKATVSDTEFCMVDAATDEVLYRYPYTILSDSLIALYEETSDAYAICYYKISGFDYTLNILGATAPTLVGSYPVNYVDQGATATIDFSLEGTAVESNQVSADGYEMNEPYEFKYCWYASDDTNLFLFVCLDNGYYAYSVEATEDGTLNLTEVGAYTYDL